MTLTLEIFHINGDNFRCGWCLDWLGSVDQSMEHAQEHFTTLKALRTESQLTMTICPKEEQQHEALHD